MCRDTRFFVNNISLKLVKNQAKPMQHLQAEVSLFENYSLPLSMLSSKNSKCKLTIGKDTKKHTGCKVPQYDDPYMY